MIRVALPALFLVLTARSSESSAPSVAFVILTQPTSWHEENTRYLRSKLRSDAPEGLIFDTVSDFSDVKGAWAVWPMLIKLHDLLVNTSVVDWIFFCEDGTIIKGARLLEHLRNYDSKKRVFLGHALRDQYSTIIHHFAFVGENVSKFSYPDLAGGMAMSWPLIQRLVEKMKGGEKPRDFTIDSKHELSLLAWEDGAGVELTDVPEFCTILSGDSCITEYSNGDYQRCQSGNSPTRNDDIVIAVKTFHGNHKTRIVVVKRTWALEARNVEYFSDQEDPYIPAIDLGVNNTERGHCQKALSILQHYVSNHANKMKWLVIADDDTLLSIPRLLQMLNCYDHEQNLIIGEIYGYGFDPNGQHGYAYPTGGAGMIFSTSAAKVIAEQCKCPSADSPDDMIIGMCAENLNVPMIHSPALHQARPIDYAVDYLKRTKPVSFHKHWEVDPYAVYRDWLAESMDQKGPESAHQSHKEL